jgi:hypothetical protein
VNAGTMPTTQEIAVRAQELKAIHLALSLSFASVLGPVGFQNAAHGA